MFDLPEGKVLRCNTVAGNTLKKELETENMHESKSRPVVVCLLCLTYHQQLQSEAAKSVAVIFPRFALTHIHVAVLLILSFFVLSFFFPGWLISALRLLVSEVASQMN